MAEERSVCIAVMRRGCGHAPADKGIEFAEAALRLPEQIPLAE